MTTQADRIAKVLREIAPDGKLKSAEIPLINELGRHWEARSPAPAEPAWVPVARALIGQREIPGPQENAWIAKGWARLGATWFNSERTPWCGFFIAHCLDAVGLPYPLKGEFARALAWAKYGNGVTPQLGAIGVKQRKGGGHVFFIVGETADGKFFKALGGNQSDSVSIVDIAKADVIAVRWPAAVPVAAIPLPTMAKGAANVRED